MTPSNGKQHGTLYEQVLDFARREIEDASSRIDELRHSLHLLEARVEAAKSVYESVAARLNLEDELENEEIQLDAPTYAAPQPPAEPPAPPMFAPESPPPTSASQQSSFPPPAPESPAQASPSVPEPPMFVPEPPAQALPPERTPQAPASESEPAPSAPGNNGASDGFSMDLIRRHLEERDKAAQEASSVPPQRPEAAPSPSSESTPPAPAPAPLPEVFAEPMPESEAKPEQPAAQGGFPGLSKADRDLIGEYLRSKRGK